MKKNVIRNLLMGALTIGYLGATDLSYGYSFREEFQSYLRERRGHRDFDGMYRGHHGRFREGWERFKFRDDMGTRRQYGQGYIKFKSERFYEERRGRTYGEARTYEREREDLWDGKIVPTKAGFLAIVGDGKLKSFSDMKDSLKDLKDLNYFKGEFDSKDTPKVAAFAKAHGLFVDEKRGEIEGRVDTLLDDKNEGMTKLIKVKQLGRETEIPKEVIKFGRDEKAEIRASEFFERLKKVSEEK